MNNCRIELSDENNNKLKFEKESKKIPVNHIMYADIECMLTNVSSTDAPSNAFQENRSFAIYHYLHSRGVEIKSEFIFNKGSDCIKDFAKNLLKKAYEIQDVSLNRNLQCIKYITAY